MSSTAGPERPGLPEIGRLGLGAANIGNLYRAVSDEQAWAVLDAAWAAGVRYYDTAPHYGLGLSERRLGAFLQTKPRAEYVISTKVGRLLRPNPAGAGSQDLAADFAVPADQQRVWDVTVDGTARSLDESLQRLGLDRVDIAFLHDPERSDDPAAALHTGVDGLVRLRDTGVVSAIGIGSMSTPALLAAARTGAMDLLMIAGRYTLLEQPAAAEVLPECRDRRIGVIAAGVFNSGLLASSAPGADARYEYGAVPDALLRRAQDLARRCHDFGVELPTAALQFALRDPLVRSVVVGAGRPEQIVENAARMAVGIPEALWAILSDHGLVTT